MSVKRRDAIALEIKRGMAESDSPTRTFGTSIMDLPEAIHMEILLRLPLKGVLVCRCTCQSWRHLILSPQFVKQHFAKSRTSLLLRNMDSTCVPRTCYHVDPSEIDIGSNQGCDEPFHFSLNVKLKIPLRNPTDAFGLEAVKKNRRVRLKLTDHKFKIVNSYNGFLCLSETSTNKPAVVCNPVTGEYINIPVGDVPYEDYVDCGFGFCTTTNQYKLIRIFGSVEKQLIDCPIHEERRYTSKVAEVHTLGTQSWVNIGYAPCYNGILRYATCLNGSLHWLHEGWNHTNSILSFDFTNNSFGNIPPPTFRLYEYDSGDELHMSLGVLRGNIYLCLANRSVVTLWVMEQYGVPESWNKLLKFRKKELGRSYICQPIDYLKDGSLLMYNYPNNLLIHYNIDTKKWDCLKVCGTKSKCEAVSLVPSFFSLKEAVQGDGRDLPNIHSRCARIELLGEQKRLYITSESKANLPSDSSSYCD